MSRNPFVSVVIITYNTGHLVERALASVLGQTFQDFEVIVVDDGSTDHTEALLAGRTDIRYLKVPNGGSASARNHGIRLARGQWVALLDSDDTWLPDKLDMQVQIARDPRLEGVGLFFSDYAEVLHSGRLVRERAMRLGFPIFTDHAFKLEEIFARKERMAGCDVYTGLKFNAIFHGNMILPSTVLMRRAEFDRLGFFKTQYRSGAEDTELFLRWAFGTDCACIDVPLIHYTIGRPGQMTAATNLQRLVRTDIRLRKDFLRQHPDFAHQNKQLASAVLSRVYARMGRLQLTRGNLRGARISYAQARRHHALTRRDGLLRHLALCPAFIVRPLLFLRQILKGFPVPRPAAGPART